MIETEQPAPAILGGNDEAIRAWLSPVRADVERLGGEGEHGHPEAVTVLGLGQARGDEPVIGDHQQRWIYFEIIGGGPCEISQEASLDGDGQGGKGVYDALAGPGQNRVAQRAAPGVLVEPVEPDDPQVLHVVRNPQLEPPGVMVFYGF
jgi:hypothetical protein